MELVLVVESISICEFISCQETSTSSTQTTQDQGLQTLLLVLANQLIGITAYIWFFESIDP